MQIVGDRERRLAGGFDETKIRRGLLRAEAELAQPAIQPAALAGRRDQAQIGIGVEGEIHRRRLRGKRQNGARREDKARLHAMKSTGVRLTSDWDLVNDG